MPTIAIFTAHYAPCPGGISRFMDITVGALVDQGCKVIVVTSDFNNPEPKNKNVVLVKLPIHDKWFGKDRYPIPIRSKIQETLSKISSEKIDRVIAITRFHPTSQVAATFARQNNIPLYLLECGANKITLNNKILDVGLHMVDGILTDRIRKYVDRWGAMSNVGLEFLKKDYGIEGDFIWHCTIKVPDGPVVKTTDKDKVVITYSGRIENLKGEHELAESFTNLSKKYDNIELNFLGTGSYLPVLKEKFANKKIKYWGDVSLAVVNKVNLASDIFVCATRFPDGGVPNAVLEAGSRKCAGITSPNGGFTDLIVHEQNGLLTKPDLSDMEECLERLIKDAKLREKLAENLYADIKSKYQPSSMAKVMLRDLGL